jgi:hypothetical protein
VAPVVLKSCIFWNMASYSPLSCFACCQLHGASLLSLFSTQKRNDMLFRNADSISADCTALYRSGSNCSVRCYNLRVRVCVCVCVCVYVCGNKVLRNFEPEREQETGGCKSCTTRRFITCKPSPYWSEYNEADWMCGPCSTRGTDEHFSRNLILKLDARNSFWRHTVLMVV